MLKDQILHNLQRALQFNCKIDRLQLSVGIASKINNGHETCAPRRRLSTVLATFTAPGHEHNRQCMKLKHR